MAEAENVTPSSITREELSLETWARQEGLPPGSVHSGTYLQRAGMKLFGWILILAGAILLMAFVYVGVYTPSMPSVPANGTPSDSIVARLIIEQRATVFANFTGILEKLVIGFSLPLMTAILGYLFGTGQVRKSE
jgi:hypothetical protein